MYLLRIGQLTSGHDTLEYDCFPFQKQLPIVPQGAMKPHKTPSLHDKMLMGHQLFR